jgi:hypothetical protein
MLISTNTVNSVSRWAYAKNLQAGFKLAANQETVNIGLSSELTAVLLADRATVDDANVLLSLGGDGLAEPLADSGVDLLSLLSGGDLSGANSPTNRCQICGWIY